jgi:hypothetical protein
MVISGRVRELIDLDDGPLLSAAQTVLPCSRGGMLPIARSSSGDWLSSDA